MTDRPMLKLHHHLAGALVGGLLGPVVPTLILLGLVLAGGLGRPVSIADAIVLTSLSWLAMAFISAPASIVWLSLFWPVTRRGTPGGRWVCLVAGITAGVLLAPLASKGWVGASPKQLLLFALSGLVASGAYCALLTRFSRRQPTAPALQAIFA